MTLDPREGGRRRIRWPASNFSRSTRRWRSIWRARNYHCPIQRRDRFRCRARRRVAEDGSSARTNAGLTPLDLESGPAAGGGSGGAGRTADHGSQMAGRFSEERHPRRPRNAGQFARANRSRSRRPANCPGSPGCIPSAKERATRAASSAPRSTDCGRPRPSSHSSRRLQN